MDKEDVVLVDIKEKAIIKSFHYYKTDILKRENIIEKARELSGESETNIISHIKVLVDENYLLIRGRSKREGDTKERRPGQYQINPKYNFIFKGVPLPSETEPIEETKPIEATPESTKIPSQLREKHTAALYPAIAYWLEYFPMPPESGDSRKFFRDVKLCEQHQLYHDLVNHLPQSDFNVCDRWEQYKADVKEIDILRSDLQKQIESDISGIFNGLKLRYVRSWEYLKDYDCYLPKLILEYILGAKKYTELRDIRLEKAKTDEEYDRIESELLDDYLEPENMAGYIKSMDFIEIGDSILGGCSGYIKYIMVPKKDRDVLTQGKDKAASYLLHPPAEIDKKAEAIMKKIALLYREREYMIKELERSIYCLSFSGDCRYLRGGSD